MASIRFANCMELPTGVWHRGLPCIPLPSVLIPYNATLCIDSIPPAVDSIRSQTSDSMQTYGLIWDGLEETTMAKRNLLLEYSEELAVKIVKLCAEYKN